jgi:hypothetical protein
MTKLNLLPDALGFNSLILGAPGAGKTSVIPTLAKAGLEVFVAFTEQGVGNLKKAMALHNLSEEEKSRIHYAYIKPGRGSFAKMAKGATEINRATEFGKMSSGNRKDHSQFIDLLNLCSNYVDQHGEEFGSIDEWDANRVLVVDGMSGLNDMCMSLVVGDKPVKTLQDWGVAIDQLDKFVKQCCNLLCGFVLLSHMEQEKDEVTGRMIVTASTLGRKLGSSIGRHFQDVILASKGKGKYQWATDDSRIELKHSYLKESAALPATFEPLIESWAKEYSA